MRRTVLKLDVLSRWGIVPFRTVNLPAEVLASPRKTELKAGGLTKQGVARLIPPSARGNLLCLRASKRGLTYRTAGWPSALLQKISQPPAIRSRSESGHQMLGTTPPLCVVLVVPVAAMRSSSLRRRSVNSGVVQSSPAHATETCAMKRLPSGSVMM